MIFNISLHIHLGIIIFPPFSNTLLQDDILSRKFPYGQHAVGTVALLSGQPALTVVVAVVLGQSYFQFGVVQSYCLRLA